MVWSYDETAGGLDGLSPAWFDATFDDTLWTTGAAPLGALFTPLDYSTTVLADSPVAYCDWVMLQILRLMRQVTDTTARTPLAYNSGKHR